MSEISQGRTSELENLADDLYKTLFSVSPDGIEFSVERSGFVVSSIVYIYHKTGETIRKMSPESYAFEFMKCCGVSLDFVYFDRAVAECGAVGTYLALSDLKGNGV